MSTVEVPRDGVEVGLPDTPPAPGALLGLVSEAYRGAREGALGDLQVVTAQLVGNAYRHARPPRRLRLRPAAGHALVRVEVEDASPSRFPVLGRLDAPEHGRGLLMVNRLAVNWGHEPRADRKTVWAEVRVG
ncbi:MAG: ATP-binding protein [Saccharothrix sp.]|nr:ATP-binding protein [Saccharothrix sp.]